MCQKPQLYVEIYRNKLIPLTRKNSSWIYSFFFQKDDNPVDAAIPDCENEGDFSGAC